MTPLEKLETLTEPHRKTIGWLSLLGSLATFIALLAVVGVSQSHLALSHDINEHVHENTRLNERILASHAGAPIIVFRTGEYLIGRRRSIDVTADLEDGTKVEMQVEIWAESVGDSKAVYATVAPKPPHSNN